MISSENDYSQTSSNFLGNKGNFRYIHIFLKLCEGLRCRCFCIIDPDRSRAVTRICFGVESWSLNWEKN